MGNIEKTFFNSSKDSPEKTKEYNVYGKEIFPPSEARKHVESIINDFKNHYSSLGYKEEPSVLISSGIDPTVRFIGSPISVLKPYFLEKRVPPPGVFMRQDCLRTKNADKLLDDNFIPKWGSYFPNMGAITPPKRFHESCEETFNFFEKRLGIAPNNLLIRISSTDKDLMKACLGHYSEENLEVDGRDPSYYRHKLGVEGVWGRACNIALRNSNGNGFSDVANIIIIENPESPLCTEISIGTTTILKQIHGLDHVQDCTPVVGLESIDAKFRRKFEDAIITSTVLFNEGLRPLGKNNRNRILKKYVQAMSYFRAKCGTQIDELSRIISEFEQRELPDSAVRISDVLVEFIKAFENELINIKELTENQQKIKQALLLLT